MSRLSNQELRELAKEAGFRIHAECGGYRVMTFSNQDVYPSGGICPTATRYHCGQFLKGYIYALKGIHTPSSTVSPVEPKPPEPEESAPYPLSLEVIKSKLLALTTLTAAEAASAYLSAESTWESIASDMHHRLKGSDALAKRVATSAAREPTLAHLNWLFLLSLSADKKLNTLKEKAKDS